jgi:hypothetical protein
MPRTARPARKPKRPASITLYVRIDPEDDAELSRRETRTGATKAAQARILIHDGLKRKVVLE